MNIGSQYYTYYIHPATGWNKLIHARWNGDMVDYKRKEEGRVFEHQSIAQRELEAAMSRWKAGIQTKPKVLEYGHE